MESIKQEYRVKPRFRIRFLDRLSGGFYLQCLNNDAINLMVQNPTLWYSPYKPHLVEAKLKTVVDLPKQCQDILESIGGCVFPEGSCQKCSQKTLNL